MSAGQLSRRKFLAGAGALVGSAALGGAVGATVPTRFEGLPTSASTGGASEPFYGPHQSGIATAPQSHGAFASFVLSEGFNRQAARRLFRVVTENAAMLTAGSAPLSDNDPELAQGPSRLTVTVGLGARFFECVGLTHLTPAGFVDVPAYDIDRLRPEWSGGDFLLQLGSDDPLVLAHALRHLTRSIRSFASPKWVQRGFWRTSEAQSPSGTSRNLMGQVDGTVNPRSTSEYAAHVWAPPSAGWFSGGTMLVVRRIAMTLDTWDALDAPGKELAIGRRLSNGAPLTGTEEFDTPDLTVLGANGLPVIPPFAHIRRARTGNDAEKFLRRPFNYDDGINANGELEAGLIFAAYAASIEAQYVPVQNALAHQDLLNKWTIPVGSAVFVLPPGCAEGSFIGESLLASA